MKKGITCKDLLIERFKEPYCPFSHCDYEGNEPEDRKYFCLLWYRLLHHSNDSSCWSLGGLRKAQMIGNKRCTKKDIIVCPMVQCIYEKKEAE